MRPPLAIGSVTGHANSQVMVLPGATPSLAHRSLP